MKMTLSWIWEGELWFRTKKKKSWKSKTKACHSQGYLSYLGSQQAQHLSHLLCHSCFVKSLRSLCVDLRCPRTASVAGRSLDRISFLPARVSLAFELVFWVLFPQCWRQSDPFLAGNRISPEVLLPFLILYLNHPVCFSLRNLNWM